MKIWIVCQLFAFILLLFVPAIAVMLFAALVIGGSAWFVGLGLVALALNAAVVWAKPVRGLIGRKLDSIARS
jgi:hypothetical protein